VSKSGAGISVHREGVARILAGALLFIIASGNGRWIWWTGLLPSLFVPPLILVLLSRGRLEQIHIQKRNFPLVCVLTLLTALAAIAMVVAPSTFVLEQFLGSYFAPLLLYVTFQSMRLDQSQIRAFWKVLTFGALIPLISGLIAYYQEWGIPTGLELLYSRYDVERMQGYMVATFGNTGNTAAFLTLLLPGWLLIAIRERLRTADRIFYGTAVAVATAHVLIVQSRTLFLTLMVMVLVDLVALRASVRVVLIVGAFAFGAGVYFFQPSDVRERFSQLTVGAFESEENPDDHSVSERIDAMRLGLQLIGDNPLLGVGPGNSATLHPATSSHQYWINQGAEIGIGGLLASVSLSMLVFWRFARSAIGARRGIANGWSFVNASGPAAFMLYGCIANMAWSATAVDTWAGLFGSMLGLSGARWADGEAKRAARYALSRTVSR
jgi:O-Antigen ligase